MNCRILNGEVISEMDYIYAMSCSDKITRKDAEKILAVRREIISRMDNDHKLMAEIRLFIKTRPGVFKYGTD